MLTAIVILLASTTSQHHVEALASAGFTGTENESDGYTQPVGSGGSIGLAGSYRYGLWNWVEIGPTAEVHYFAARSSEKRFSPSAVVSLTGSIRFRMGRANTFVLDLGGGVLRVDSAVPRYDSGTAHWWTTQPCGRLGIGGMWAIGAATSLLFQAVIIAGYGRADSDRDAGIHAGPEAVVGSFHLQVGGRFDL